MQKQNIVPLCGFGLSKSMKNYAQKFSAILNLYKKNPFFRIQNGGF